MTFADNTLFFKARFYHPYFPHTTTQFLIIDSNDQKYVAKWRLGDGFMRPQLVSAAEAAELIGSGAISVTEREIEMTIGMLPDECPPILRSQSDRFQTITRIIKDKKIYDMTIAYSESNIIVGHSYPVDTGNGAIVRIHPYEAMDEQVSFQVKMINTANMLSAGFTIEGCGSDGIYRLVKISTKKFIRMVENLSVAD